jgi:nicotinate phosphoribosyltransferase
MDIFDNFARFINSDRYQYTESDVYLANNMQDRPSIFNFFFRKTEDANFAVVAGTMSALRLINLLHTSNAQEKHHYFSQFGFDKNMVDYLMELKFTGDVYAMREGELAFAGEPVCSILDRLVVAKIIETPLLNSYNYQMAIASKASRISRAAGDIPVLAFGPRRAHGFDASVLGTRAALIGGATMHSSMATQYFFDTPSVGSMSHSFIQSFGMGKQAEYEAFITFAKRQLAQKSGSIFFLVDTYDTIKSGLHNAIKVCQQLGIDNHYQGIFGIRLDSGDLAYFSKAARKLLDEAGLTNAKILLSNSLNEHLISELKLQGTPFDLVGVGDALATSKDNPCFGGVYKLVDMAGQPILKLSNDALKITTPSHKNVYRIYQNGEACADLITLAQHDSDEAILLAGKELTIVAEEDRLKTTTFKAGSYQVELLTQPMMLGGQLTELGQMQSNLDASRDYYQQRLQTFSPERKRITNPHHYKVSLSTNLYDLKYSLIKQLTDEVHGE